MFKKNIVYKITCTLWLCTKRGKTIRTIRTRVDEHTNQKFGKIYKHFVAKNKKIPKLESIKWEIVSKGFISALHRLKVRENKTKQQKPGKNVQNYIKKV